MKNTTLPEPYVDVMITFRDANGTRIIKRGFYCTLFEEFAIPPEWRDVQIGGKIVSLPHGFGGYHLKPEDIIEWSRYKKLERYENIRI